MTIGSKIRHIRLEKGIKQKELATLAGIPTITLQQYERGVTKQPKIEQVQKIAAALGISISYLLGVSDDPSRETFVAQAFDSAIQENLMQKAELVRDVNENLVSKLEAIEKAKDSHIKTVLSICVDSQKADAIQQAHEMELLPARIAIVTEFIEQHASTLKEMMPGMLPESKK